MNDMSDLQDPIGLDRWIQDEIENWKTKRQYHHGKVIMRRKFLIPILLSSFLLAAPIHAQDAQSAESDYLQHRAGALNDRIDIAVREHKLSKKKAARLRVSVGRVQSLAGTLQTRGGTIDRSDADQMNQQLTDVERALPPQP